MPTLDTTASLRPVTGLVKVNGIPVPWVSIEIENNNFFQADSFSLKLPLQTMPAGFGPDFWASDTQAEVEILIGLGSAFTAGPLVSMILGQTDTILMAFPGNEVLVSGRDYTSTFIDTRTINHYPNLTSSQIATKLAAAHGFQAQVTPTSTQVGKYYEIDKVKLGAQDSHEVTEWALLTYLARFEDFDCFMQGRTLHFQPKADETADPFVINYQPATQREGQKGNVSRIAIERSLNIARDVTVKIQSWNQKSKTGFTVTAKAQHSLKSQAAGGLGQVYTFTIPNLGKDQALKIAQQRANEISRHERLMTYDGPGNIQITPRSLLRLAGTGTSLDQAYFVDRIQRHLSLDEGFTMVMRAKNHSTISEVTV